MGSWLSVVLSGILAIDMVLALHLAFWNDVAAEGAYGNGSDHLMGLVC